MPTVKVIIMDGCQRKNITYDVPKYNGDTIDLHDRVITGLPMDYAELASKYMEFHNINVGMLNGKDQDVVRCKRELCWLLFHYTSLKMDDIAKFLKYKQHGTVSYHIKRQTFYNNNYDDMVRINDFVKHIGMQDFKVLKSND